MRKLSRPTEAQRERLEHELVDLRSQIQAVAARAEISPTWRDDLWLEFEAAATRHDHVARILAGDEPYKSEGAA